VIHRQAGCRALGCLCTAFVDSNVFLANLTLNGRLLGRGLFRSDNLTSLNDSFFNYRLFIMELNRELLVREGFALVGRSAAGRLSIDTDCLATKLYWLIDRLGLYNFRIVTVPASTSRFPTATFSS